MSARMSKRKRKWKKTEIFHKTHKNCWIFVFHSKWFSMHIKTSLHFINTILQVFFFVFVLTNEIVWIQITWNIHFYYVIHFIKSDFLIFIWKNFFLIMSNRYDWMIVKFVIRCSSKFQMKHSDGKLEMWMK